jgi:hypothetical protein
MRYNNVELTRCGALDIRDEGQERKPSYIFLLYEKHHQAVQ